MAPQPQDLISARLSRVIYVCIPGNVFHRPVCRQFHQGLSGGGFKEQLHRARDLCSFNCQAQTQTNPEQAVGPIIPCK